MAKLSEIIIDSLHPAGLARFWVEALDDYGVRPYDDSEIERLRSLGFTPETDPAVAVDGPGPTLFFQYTDTAKGVRNRIHLDIVAQNRADEIARLCRLGASVRDEHETHSVLLDPEGNEFCVQDAGR
jgi:hypothetical protein